VDIYSSYVDLDPADGRARLDAAMKCNLAVKVNVPTLDIQDLLTYFPYIYGVLAREPISSGEPGVRPSKKNEIGTRRMSAIVDKREGLTRLAPASYFCTC
jgi:hypothetical protein